MEISFFKVNIRMVLSGLPRNTEATKALLLTTLKEIKVYKDKINVKGGNLPLYNGHSL